MIELLAPVGNLERLNAAFHFGADAIYLSGKNFGLRAFSDNFDNDELKIAVDIAHKLNKKVYITLNIFAHNDDFIALTDYIKYLELIKVDAVIISDTGIFSVVKKVAPKLAIHISTQNNVTNKYAAKFWADEGAERIVLARELNLTQIREIRDFIPQKVMIEAFVHGAMCISYSGRCLLSNFLTGRFSNHGECAQSCRWEYQLVEKNRKNEPMDILEDERGSYILNSKDMCMINYIDKLVDAGIESFKIEGRVKTAYYVANTVNAYRRAINIYQDNPKNFTCPKDLVDELYKSSHRGYTTGFYFNAPDTECYTASKPDSDFRFCAIVTEVKEGGVVIMQRNRFKKGDSLEILSPDNNFNSFLKIDYMQNENGEEVVDALIVQEMLFVQTDIKLSVGDILRVKA